MLEYGYIKLPRKIMSFWWYEELTTYKLFTHMLMNANYTEQEWHGTIIPCGSFISSYQHLADQAKLTVQEVRTALNHLEAHGEVTRKSSPKGTIFTIVKYTEYQGKSNINTVSNTVPNTPNQRVTNTDFNTLISDEKSAIIGTFSGYEIQEQHTDQHTDQHTEFRVGNTGSNTHSNNNVRNIKNNKRILMIDDVRDEADFCLTDTHELKSAYTELTGNVPKDEDLAQMQDVYCRCTDIRRIISVMRKVTERKNGAEINSFKYFVPEIDREINRIIMQRHKKKKPPGTNADKGLCPETATTEDYERALDAEWNTQMQTFYSGEYIYDD